MIRGIIIGAGYFANFHAEAWQRIAGVEIVAVVDSDVDKAQAFAAQWSIPRAFASASAAIEGERPDFVDIATRPATHLELTRAAASRGCHVFCQKPMAESWEECVQMVAACEAGGVRLLIHENWRWQPWHREIRRLLDAHELGRVFQLSMRWRSADGHGVRPYELQPYFRQMPQFLLIETLVHWLDTSRFLLGEIASVYCIHRRINRAILGEDQALILLSFANGALGSIDAHRLSVPAQESHTDKLLVEGENGTLRLAFDDRLWLAKRCEVAEREHIFSTTRVGYRGDSVCHTQRHFIDCLQSGRSCESEGREYLKTVLAVLACYSSAANGKQIVLKSFTPNLHHRPQSKDD